MLTASPTPTRSSRSRAAAFVAVLALGAVALQGCRSGPLPGRADEVREGARLQKELRSYHVIRSPYQGKIGYLKVYDVREEGGPTYQWKYVYDLKHEERGWIDQFGTAYMEQPYAPGVADGQPYPVRVLHLPSDTTERNVLRMLGIDPATDDATFHVASNADIASK